MKPRRNQRGFNRFKKLSLAGWLATVALILQVCLLGSCSHPPAIHPDMIRFEDNARLFALLDLASDDAYIAAYALKAQDISYPDGVGQ